MAWWCNTTTKRPNENTDHTYLSHTLHTTKSCSRCFTNIIHNYHLRTIQSHPPSLIYLPTSYLFPTYPAHHHSYSKCFTNSFTKSTNIIHNYPHRTITAVTTPTIIDISPNIIPISHIPSTPPIPIADVLPTASPNLPSQNHPVIPQWPHIPHQVSRSQAINPLVFETSFSNIFIKKKHPTKLQRAEEIAILPRSGCPSKLSERVLFLIESYMQKDDETKFKAISSNKDTICQNAQFWWEDAYLDGRIVVLLTAR